MELSRHQISAYIQAGISFLLILCTFLPYISHAPIDIDYSLSFISISTIELDAENKYKMCGYAFILYFMLHTLNIYLQAHGSHKSFSGCLSVMGFGGLLIMHILLEDDKALKETEYSIGFYLIFILLIALLIIPSIIETPHNEINGTSPSGQADSQSDEDNEIEMLKARIKELEEQNNE